MRKIKILQIASYEGNIGDILNFLGFRGMLSDLIQSEILWYNLEIRDFYFSRSNKVFDSNEFIDTCNQADLIVIGGGGFFDALWHQSQTGCTLNISSYNLSKILKPIIFYGLGFTSNNDRLIIDKFGSFLSLLDNSKYYVSVRNDGSIEMINSLLYSYNKNHVLVVPDGAFFYKSESSKMPPGKRLGVNIAKDDIKNRFSLSSVPSEEVYKDFIKSFANIIQDFANEGYYFIFFPHIYSDLQAISDLLTSLPDKIVRERVTVERLHSDVELVKDTVKSYLACNLFIGMRFHSCLLSIKLNIPTLGIATTNKIRGLFNAMKIEKQAIDPLEIISKKRLTDIIDLKKIRPISNKEINDLIDVHFAEEGSLTQLRDFINKSVFSNN